MKIIIGNLLGSKSTGLHIKNVGFFEFQIDKEHEDFKTVELNQNEMIILRDEINRMLGDCKC
jgi:hypothetical protein